MQVDALEPFTYRWPEGEVKLRPGTPVELPADRAMRIHAKAPGKVRLRATHNEWLSAWREVEVMARAITSREDPRFPFVMAVIDFADEFFLADDWPGFQRALSELKKTIQGHYPSKQEPAA